MSNVFGLFIKPEIQDRETQGKQVVFTRIPGNLLEDSTECYHFRIPGNVQDDSEEYCRIFQGIFENILGNIQEDCRGMFKEIPGIVQRDSEECSRRV